MAAGVGRSIPGRGARIAALAFALGLLPAGRAGGDDGWRPTGEWFGGPFRGHRYAVEHEEGTGRKRLVAPDGRTFASTEEVAAWEESLLDPRERLLGTDLAALCADPRRADEPVDVTFLMALQPLHDAGTAARERHGPALNALLRRQRAILDRIAPLRAADPDRLLQIGERAEEERRLLTDEERTALRALREETLSILRSARREALDEARPRAIRDQQPLADGIAALPGARVTGRSVALSAVSARMRAGDVEETARRFPGVSRVLTAEVHATGLNTSVGTIGASSWTSAGYDGSSTTKVAVLDTGMYASHSSLSSVITNQAVYLSAASGQSNFNDDASTTDDKQGHGTHVGGTVMGTNSTYKGVAPGGGLMNAKVGYKTTSGGGSLISTDVMSGGDWAVDNGADALNYSAGGTTTTNGNSSLSLFYDAIVFDLNIGVAVAAGNSGSSSGTVTAPADGFNVIGVGNFDDAGTSSDHSDNSLASSSSRGPCSDGRRKPDLSAPGTSITSSYIGGTTTYATSSGTSMACPHVAGSLCLLEDYSTSWAPEAMKALLLTNVRNSSPYPTTPDNDWGYGGLNLSAAYTNRSGVIEGTLTSSGNRYALLKGNSLASGGRTTLVWNRQVTHNNSSTPTTYKSLLDLDLYVYDGSDGSQDGSSTSTVNSVEQVKLSSALTSPVFKVYRSGSFSSGVTTEYFAVASETSSSLTAATPPTLTASFSATPSTYVAGSTDSTVSVKITNSGTVSCFSPSVTLTLPSGYSVQSGANPQTLSTIAAGGNQTATWTVRSGTDSSGTRTLSASGTSTSYGETFTASSVSSSHTLDITAPSGTVSIAGGASATATTSITLTLSATDGHSGMSQMRFSNDNSTWGSWATYATSSAWTLASGQGTKTVYAQFKDAVGNTSSSVSDTITLDTSAPTGTVSVAAGATHVNSTSVTLTLSASDTWSSVSNMRFSNDGTTWGSWTAYATSSSWTLASGDGAKTVYAQFRDAASNASSSVTDGITLDTAAPTGGSISVNAAATWTTSTSVTLTLSATDSSSGMGSMRFSNDNSAWGSWTTYATSSSWTLASGDGSKTVYAQFRDAAGNATSSVSDGISLDGTVPSSASVTVAGGATYATGTSVSLAHSATDAFSGISQMRFSNDGSTWGSWTTWATSSSWTLASGDGEKTVYLQVRDFAGNSSSNATDGITLDTTSPSGTVSVAGGASWTAGTSVTLTLSGSDSTSGVADMRFSNDGTTWGSWTTYGSSAAWTLVSGDGSKTVYAQFRDAAGLSSSSASDGIGLDTAAPSGTVTVAGGTAWATGTLVTLALSGSDATSGVTGMRFSNDGSAWGSWNSYAVSASWDLTSGDGSKTVYAQFRDAAGNVSSSASDGIGLDTTAPIGTVTAAGGADWTTDASIALSLTASDTTSGLADMRFSNDGSTWDSWSSYAASASWDLASGDGTKTVYAQFRDVAGNVSSSASDGVGLDGTAPSGTVDLAGGAAWTGTVSVTLDLAGSDGTSGVAEMRLSEDGSTWGSWTAYATSAPWTLASGDGSKSVHAQFRDAAGNESATASDSIGLDATAPTGSVTAAGGATWTASATVALALSASDGGAGLDAMRFSNDGSTWGSWAAYATSASWGLASGDGAKTVYAQFRDAAGNVSADATDGIGLDTSGPTGSVTLDGGAAWTGTTAATLALSSSDAHSGVTEMRLGDDGSTWGSWTAFATSSAWTLASGDGSKSVYAQFRDAVGNVSGTASDSIGLDTTPPSGTVSVDGGAAWADGTGVTLDLSASDASSGSDSVRFSNDGSTWGSWAAYSTTASWTLASGDGSKTVHAQFRDAVGNVSSTATDDIDLDTTAPSATVAILGGKAATNDAAVTLDAGWSDALSGVDALRCSNDGTTWSEWASPSTTVDWDLAAGEGTRTVHLQARDAAGNVSSSANDSILLDVTPPAGTFTLNGDAAYVLPIDALRADTVSSDGTGGSGVVSFRYSHDGGATWSGWQSLSGGPAVAMVRPAGRGHRTALGQFQDDAGNLSAEVSDGTQILEDGPADLAAATSVSGSLAPDGDLDLFRVPMVQGDLLSLKVKLVPIVLKGDAAAHFTIHSPTGAVLAAGRWPEDAAKPGVKAFPAATTGVHWVVLRAEGADAGAGAAYSIKPKIKPAKGTRAVKGSATGGAVAFAAIEESTLTGTLAGAADPLEIAPPDGSDAFGIPSTAKGTSLAFGPIVLEGGTGSYSLRYSGEGTASYAIKLAGPARVPVVEGTDPSLP